MKIESFYRLFGRSIMNIVSNIMNFIKIKLEYRVIDSIFTKDKIGI